ncbi:acetate uptake transporter [Marinilactibacillus kalidii]|uniref:acetate uptake transporter n=1 Tax=Marinilactibacillus kalidii TaxID=2820274 RepID=UPI001ABEA57A|nr:acetate uptake transporter [Marinilactibacillus kalidii]
MSNGIPEGKKIAFNEITANPAPLGLLGFGMTTVLLNIHNAGFFPINPMIIAMGIFYGGLAQVVAGIMEWKKNNTFGTTAFTSYGFFWLSFAALNLLPMMGLGEPTAPEAMSAYLFMWGLFTLGLFIATLRISRALQVVFGSLALLFFLLAIGDFTGSEMVITVAGYEGIICGFSAVYAGLAQVINEVYGKTLMPLGEVK